MTVTKERTVAKYMTHRLNINTGASRALQRFSIKCRKLSRNYFGFGFGFATVWDWLRSLTGE